MNEENSTQLIDPVHRSKQIRITIVAVIMTAALVGGSVYWWHKSILQSSIQFLQQKMTSLENQVSQLQELKEAHALQFQQNTFQDATNNNKDWLVYQSQRWGFVFQYPLNYVLDTTYEDQYSDQGHIHLYDKSTFEAIQKGKMIEGAPLIEFSVYDNREGLSAFEWAQKETGYSNFTGEYKTIQINSRDAMFYSWSGLGGGDAVVLTSDDKKFIYSFGVLYMNDDAEIRNDFLKILETIQLNKKKPLDNSYGSGG